MKILYRLYATLSYVLLVASIIVGLFGGFLLLWLIFGMSQNELYDKWHAHIWRVLDRSIEKNTNEDNIFYINETKN